MSGLSVKTFTSPVSFCTPILEIQHLLPDYEKFSLSPWLTDRWLHSVVTRRYLGKALLEIFLSPANDLLDSINRNPCMSTRSIFSQNHALSLKF